MKEILRRVWENLFSQLSGPLNFRFIVQPAFAGYLAIRAGLKDAQQNRLTFLWAAIINSASRRTLSRQFWNDGWKVFALAMVVDAIYQVIVQRGVYVLELLIVATSLALVPYLLLRSPASRIAGLFYRDVATQSISIPNEPPAEIKGLIDRVLRGFNNKDSVLYNSAFSRDAVVIDGIAPYLWTGPNAQARWFSDAEQWVRDFGVESETIVCDRIAHSTVGETHAYVVLSATLFFTLKAGGSGSRPGILTFTFMKQADTWKVESQAWGRLS